MAHTFLSRLCFLSKGCKQAPLDATKGLVRWGHPDGYFLRANGMKAADKLSPAKLNNPNTHGGLRPYLTDCGQYCHTLMLITFYGPRPEPRLNPTTGKIEKFEGDHKNGDKYNYRPDNLEWVFESENRWRFHHVIKVLRFKGIDPATYTGPQMDLWFALFRAYEIAGRKPIQIPANDLLSDFEHSCLNDPDKQIEREMTRHMER
jgi:hypothetical protein